MNQKGNVKFRINNQITTNKIRLVGTENKDGIYTYYEALDFARKEDVDLIEISFKDDTSICKLMEYKKFLYQLKQKEKETKANQKTQLTKEIRLSPEISENDLSYRIKNAIEFLKEGNKVKLTLIFKGRAINFREKGELVLLQFADAVKENCVLENMPKLEGKKMSCTLKPKK